MPDEPKPQENMKILAFFLALAVIAFFLYTRPITVPEALIAQIACSDMQRLNQHSKLNCMLYLNLGRVLNDGQPL